MKNTIHLGDCLNILPSIPDKSVDLVICDLPYGELKALCKWDNVIDMKKFWKQIDRVLKNGNCPVVLWGSLKFFTTVLYPSNPKWYRYEIIVKKSNASNPFLAKLRPRNDVEYMFVFSKNKPYYYYEDFHKISRTFYKNSPGLFCRKKSVERHEREPKLPRISTIIKQNLINARTKKIHPTKKCAKCQYDLCKYLVRKGGVILDPCMGCGTSQETAKMLECDFIGIEKEPKYFYKNSLLL